MRIVDKVATEMHYEMLLIYAPRVPSEGERLAIMNEISAQYELRAEHGRDVDGRMFYNLQRM